MSHWSLLSVFCCSESSKGYRLGNRFDTLPLRMLARPHVSVLGRIHGSTRFQRLGPASRPMNVFPGLFLFRVRRLCSIST